VPAPELLTLRIHIKVQCLGVEVLADRRHVRTVVDKLGAYRTVVLGYGMC
jgi:hypothetical protein